MFEVLLYARYCSNIFHVLIYLILTTLMKRWPLSSISLLGGCVSCCAKYQPLLFEPGTLGVE